MDAEIKAHSLLDDEKKALIRQAFGIDMDSDLFDPRYDYVAKRILTAETANSKLALIDLLNAAIALVDGEPVVDLTVINPELAVDSDKHKKSKFDIRSRFQSGVDHTLFEGDKEYFRDGRFRDAHGVSITDDQTIIFLELTKIRKLLKKPVEQLTDIECWLIFFKYIADKSKRKILNKIIERKEGVNVATQILQTISKSERERSRYESQLIYELDQRSEKASAEARGKKTALLQVAKNLKQKNIPIEIISETTGFPLEEVAAL